MAAGEQAQAQAQAPNPLASAFAPSPTGFDSALLGLLDRFIPAGDNRRAAVEADLNQRSVRDLAAFGQMLLGVGQEQATNGLTSAPWSLRGTEPRAVWLMATSGMPAPDAILQAEREAAELEVARQADEARLAAV